MTIPTSICFLARMVHTECLEALFTHSQVNAVIIDGPNLTPLPFLADPMDFAKRFNVKSIFEGDISRERLTGLASVADVGVSLGCARVLRRNELQAPRFGTFNLHPGALPKYRGKHPDIFAMMDGQNKIGITLHRMNAGIDTGPIVAQHTQMVSPGDTIVTMTDRLYSRGAALLAELLQDLGQDHTIHETEQPTRFDHLEVRRVINWQDSAWRIARLVNALTFPWPMAKTCAGGKTFLISKLRIAEDDQIQPGRVLAILDDGIRVGTGGHSVDILEMRGEDRKIIPLKEFAVDYQIVAGVTQLGESLPC